MNEMVLREKIACGSREDISVFFLGEALHALHRYLRCSQKAQR